MPAAHPPSGFAGATLKTAEISAGMRYGRITWSRCPDPPGFGKTPSRFSDPRRRMENRRFGVLYLGESFKVCFLVAVLRDQPERQLGPLPLDEKELTARRFAEVEVRDSLTVVDLRWDGPVAMGVPSGVIGARKHSLARRWSLAFHEHPLVPDGILYPSRLNGLTNLAVYDGAIRKLEAVESHEILQVPELAAVLDTFEVRLV